MGADVNARSNSGCDALHYVFLGDTQTDFVKYAKLILRNGFDVQKMHSRFFVSHDFRFRRSSESHPDTFQKY